MLTAASFRPAIAAALAAAGLAALTGCSSSFNYATDRPNVIANGGFGTSTAYQVPGTQQSIQLRVSGAVIVATTPKDTTGPADAGVFTASLALAPQTNGSTVSDASLTALGLKTLAVDTTANTKTADTVTATIASPIVLKTTGVGTAGTLNMTDPRFGGIAVTGSFTPGDIVPIVLTLAQGQTVTLEVPVVNACGVYQFATAKPVASTAPIATEYTEYIAGNNPLPALTETASPGKYDCATPTLRASQGAAAAAATVTVTATPSASATKH